MTDSPPHLAQQRSRSTSVTLPPPDASQPENDHETVEEARRILAAAELSQTQAAAQIQKCWREYRDAVARLESLTETGEMDEVDDAWPADDNSSRRARASSRSSACSDASDLHSIIQSILTTAGDLDDEFSARDETIREYAATIIQRRVRRSLLPVSGASRSPTTSTTGPAVCRSAVYDMDADEDASPHTELSVPDSALQALRILQNRFRFQRFRRMIEEREQNELIRRIQQLWRRRKNLKQHFEALHSGREDVAARDIQRAYLRHRNAAALRDQDGNGGCSRARPTRQPPPAAPSSCGHAAVFQPLCIICMHQAVQIAFLPCGHAHTCVPCAAQCLRCPTCRRMVALQIRIYL